MNTKEFLNIYNEIINNANMSPEYIGMNIFNILDEWVESPDLIEFPKVLQIELCKNLRKHFDFLYLISYKKIVEILKQYNYEYTDDVIKGLQKYNVINNGNLILICIDIDDTNNLYDNKSLNFIKDNFNDIYDNAYHIFSNIYNNRNTNGLTIFHRDEYEPENAYTCIYINRKISNLKDILEHELTHFIKNVAKYGNKFPKIYTGLTLEKLKDKRIKAIDYITNILIKLGFSNYVYFSIKELILRTFTNNEEQPTIKSIVNAFIRYYENDKEKYMINYSLKTINQIENSLNKEELIKFRSKWISNFLEYINSYQILKLNKDKIREYFIKKQYSKNEEIEFILKCILYLCFNYSYPEYNLDNIIKNNFKTFKFRDV